ncbi:MAG: hypothetical protein IJ887_00630 [Prevotella sp.]|nr:hypothetical protein [Prevotella sp.]
MRTEGQTVYVLWYGKVLQGNVVKENDMFGMTAVRIPLQGQNPTALFTPGHVYDTPEEAENSKSVPKIAKSVPEIEESVPKVSETSQCEAFKKAHWDTGRNCLRTDSLDEFYSLWKKEHAPLGYTETPTPKPAPVSGTKPCTKATAKKQTETIQLSLFD